MRGPGNGVRARIYNPVPDGNGNVASLVRWSYIFGGTEAVSSEALTPLKLWNEQTPIAAGGERRWMNRCFGCNKVFDVNLGAHMDAIDAHVDELLYAGKISAEQWANAIIGVDFITTDGEHVECCGRWWCTYFWVEGGTKLVGFADGKALGSQYNDDGKIVREF